MYKTGCILGKFYPPHSGHKYLVQSALAKCEKVFLFICGKTTETPNGKLREKWLKEIHGDVVKGGKLVISSKNTDGYADDNSVFWAEITKKWLDDDIPDAVFTSETYGDPWSRALGCVHELVDMSRTTFPVSGTAVRKNPWSNWKHLDPCVRQYYALRIVLVGAESTGKTTLAKYLCEKYSTNWVHEVGREMWEEKYKQFGEGFAFSTDDFCIIAKKQAEIENFAAKKCNKILICDTDAFATTIWHERYLGCESAEVEEIARQHEDEKIPSLYLLSDVKDALFVQDGTRDGEHMREWMHARFVEELEKTGRKFFCLTGSYSDRELQAVAFIDSYINRDEFP